MYNNSMDISIPIPTKGLNVINKNFFKKRSKEISAMAETKRPQKQIVRATLEDIACWIVLKPKHQLRCLSHKGDQCKSCGCPYQPSGASLANSPICNGTLLFLAILEGYVNGRCDIADPCGRVVGVDNALEEYDFIVVGAGAAGPIVASRLTEDSDVTVLLLEAGGPDPVPSRVPSFYRSYWSNAETDWVYRTVPQNYCLAQDGKGCTWPRGKTLGGCTVLNGMMYHRGHAADYEDWVDLGATGWSWEDNLPYFYKSEDNKEIGTVVSKQYHATGGPMPIQRFRHQPEMVFDLISAMNESGYPVIDDMNDPTTPEGFVIAQTFTDDGQRFSVARAYLKPESERPNLHTLVNAQVTRVLFNGTQAYGVEYIRNNVTKRVLAKKEVILSAGALNTPQLLLLSGVGPRETLDAFDISVVADLPEVGQNLRNNIGGNFYFVLENVPNFQTLNWAGSTEYLLQRNGSMTSTGITQFTGIFYSSLANKTRQQPDLQFFFNGFYEECSRTGAIGEPVTSCPQTGMNISITSVALRPRSVGYLNLTSADPLAKPLFYPQYFSHPEDMVMIKDGAKMVKQIVETEILTTKYGIKLDPKYNSVCNSAGEEWSDKWLECIILTQTDPQNHQLGTAAIGTVVDTRLRVYNTTGLRVVDASVMPIQPTGNPQGAIMMVAERAADMIKEDWK